MFICFFVYLDLFITVKNSTGFSASEYLRINVYGSSSSLEGETISAKFSVIDSNSNEIAVIERSWSGLYLAAEFCQCNLFGKKYIFPCAIFGKERIYDNNVRRKGTSLEKYYNENFQCMLLGFGSSYNQRKSLYKISSFAVANKLIPKFGTVKYITVDLSSCEHGKFYSIGSDGNYNLLINQL